MVTINLEENDAITLAVIITSWRSGYEAGSDRMLSMLQDLNNGLAPEEGWDEPTVIRRLKANDKIIETLNKALDQIIAPIVL